MMLLWTRLTNHLFTAIALSLIIPWTPASAEEPQHYSYAVVISETALKDPSWKNVADSLTRKHSVRGPAKLFSWRTSVNDVRDALSSFNPDYIGFIALPVSECNSSFIVAVSRLTRNLDSDPYGDAVWGIITGYEASDALHAITDTLTVKTVVAASNNLSYEPPIQRFYQAIGMTCDSYTKTDYLFSGKAGKIVTENKRPGNEQDRIKLVASWLNSATINLSVAGQGALNGPVDCIITGGHGNVNLWQCHYPEADNEGFLQSKAGKLIAAPFSGNPVEIQSPTPKVFWCASNCLMGNPDSKDNIVYAAFHSGHAVQMFGFVNNASAGDEFMAWGVFDRVTKNAGIHTLPQGFFLSNNNALFEIENPTGQLSSQQVKLFMDSTVVYGDPAAHVTFYDVGDSARVYSVNLEYQKSGNGKKGIFTLSVTMRAHDLEFGAGYCYQFRPISLLPCRIDPGTVVIDKNEGHHPEITDNLVIWEMLAKGEKLSKGSSRSISWTADITDDKTGNLTNVPKRGFTSPKSCTMMQIGKTPLLQFLIRNAPTGNGLLSFHDLTGRILVKKQWKSCGTPVQQIDVEVAASEGLGVMVLEIGGHKIIQQCIR